MQLTCAADLVRRAVEELTVPLLVKLVLPTFGEVPGRWLAVLELDPMVMSL